MIFVKVQKQPEFVYSDYKKEQQVFEKQHPNHNEVKNDLIKFVGKVRNTKDPKDVKETVYDILPKGKVDAEYLALNDDQLRTVARKVYHQGKKFIGRDDVKMLNTVYCTDKKFSAYMGIPQMYLFFVMREDEKELCAFMVSKNSNGYQIKRLWNKEVSTNSKLAHRETGRLLLIFSSKAF